MVCSQTQQGMLGNVVKNQSWFHRPPATLILDQWVFGVAGFGLSARVRSRPRTRFAADASVWLTERQPAWQGE